MRVFRNVLRWYSYIFETVLCTMGLLLTAFTLASNHVQVRVPWLPWSEASRVQWIAGLSAAGLICVGLAVFGILRMFLFVYSGIVAAILARGLFLSTQYTFQGRVDARNAALLVCAGLLAFIGAFPMRTRRHMRRS